jgi:hypothetical protein
VADGLDGNQRGELQQVLEFGCLGHVLRFLRIRLADAFLRP